MKKHSTILHHLTTITLVHRCAFALLEPSRSQRLTHRCLATMTNYSEESLSHFLQKRRRKPTSHVVIGNQAGDTDSIVSALAAAYLADDDDATPIVSIPQNDLMTQRPETMLLLRMAGIETTDLWFSDQLDDYLLSSEALSMTLVDHNRLDSSQLESRGQVIAIYDHHMDEGYHKDSSRIRNIAFGDDGKATVASTCTLMVERMEGTWPADLSLLLLGVILIDSVDMSPEAGKVTRRDEAAVQKLLTGTDWRQIDKDEKMDLIIHPQPNTTALFDALQNAKFDSTFWKSLLLFDALRLDFKVFTAGDETFGMSSVLLPAEDLIDKNDALGSIQAFMKHQNLDFLGIMLAYTKDTDLQLTRELILCGNESLTMFEWLKSEGTLQLSFREKLEKDDQTVIVLDQGNSNASRKQVAPLLIKYFQATTRDQIAKE